LIQILQCFNPDISKRNATQVRIQPFTPKHLIRLIRRENLRQLVASVVHRIPQHAIFFRCLDCDERAKKPEFTDLLLILIKADKAAAPVSVTRKTYDRSDPQVTTIEWIGPFKEPEKAFRVTKSSIDFSRLLVALLVVNCLPAVILWRYHSLVGA
jgi:hypothetical protein